MQEQNTEKTVALSVKTGKMTAKVLKGAVKAFLDAQKNKKPHIYKGKQSVKHLVQGGGELTSIEVTDKNIKSFDKTARKYGIDYASQKGYHRRTAQISCVLQSEKQRRSDNGI